MGRFWANVTSRTLTLAFGVGTSVMGHSWQFYPVQLLAVQSMTGLPYFVVMRS
jgi:uncharacterized protein YukJ